MFWFGFQFLTDPNSGVAWVAHVAGFLFGAVVGLAVRAASPRPPPGRWARPGRWSHGRPGGHRAAPAPLPPRAGAWDPTGRWGWNRVTARLGAGTGVAPAPRGRRQAEGGDHVVDAAGQGLDVGGVDGGEQRHPQLVAAQLAVGLGVDDAVGPQHLGDRRWRRSPSARSIVATTGLRWAGSATNGVA